jgi:hypothetical protein
MLPIMRTFFKRQIQETDTRDRYKRQIQGLLIKYEVFFRYSSLQPSMIEGDYGLASMITD